VCWDTFFVLDRLGRPRPITQLVHITPGLKHDLLSGRHSIELDTGLPWVLTMKKLGYMLLKRERSTKQGHLLL
jgi:hypothetical protein